MGIEKFLIEKNIARDKKQAEIVMIAMIVVCMLFIGYKTFRGKKQNNTELTPEQIKQLENMEGLVPPGLNIQ